MGALSHKILIMEYLLELPQIFFDEFLNPKKRVFIPYIILSIFIAFGWLILFQKKNLKNAFYFIFNRKVFFSKSAKGDYKVFLINQIIMNLISPHLITQITIATFIYFFLFDLEILEMGYFSSTPKYLIVSLFTISHFLVDDFSKYIVHRFMHQWRFLWAFHKVHHSATNLTPITVFRTHPVEGLLFTLRSAIAQGLIIAVFIFLFRDGVDLYTILGANIFVFFFNIFGSNLRHSHIGIRYWKWLEYVLISPAQHHLHHSVAEEHHNKNFGAALAIWDWIFGSLHHSENTQNLVLGVKDKTKYDLSSLKGLYLLPLMESWNSLKRNLIKNKKIENSNL